MMRQSKRAIAVFLAVCTLMMAGCQKAAEKAAEKAIEAGIAKEGGGKANVDLSGGKVTVETKEGTVSYSGGKDAKVPENFPKDVYVYEGATIMAAVAVPDGFSLTMETKDPSDKAIGTIKSKMTGFGWKEEASFNQGKNAMVAYKKGERTVSVSVDAQQSSSTITVIAGSEKPKAK